MVLHAQGNIKNPTEDPKMGPANSHENQFDEEQVEDDDDLDVVTPHHRHVVS